MSKIIEIIEHCVVAGEVALRGELVECAEGDARALVAYGKAIFHVAEPEKPEQTEGDRNGADKVKNRD